MNILIGAIKSKTIWLGFVQAAYGLFELWGSGTLTAESAAPVVTGILTIIFRMLTTQSLSEKA